MGGFLFQTEDKKKGRIIKMYKLILNDLIDLIDCLVDFWQMPMPNAQSNRYPYPFPLNIYSSLFSQRPRVISFCIPLPPAIRAPLQTAVSGHPAAPPTRHRIRGHLTPKKRGAGGDFGLRANPLSRGKLMGVGGDRRSGD